MLSPQICNSRNNSSVSMLLAESESVDNTTVTIHRNWKKHDNEHIKKIKLSGIFE